MAIAGIDRMKSRDVKVRGHHESQSNGSPGSSMLFLMPAWGQFGWGVGIDPGIEIRGIIDHRGQIPSKLLDHMARSGGFCRTNVFGSEGVHMVPKTLAG